MNTVVCDKCKKVITDETKLKTVVKLDVGNKRLNKYAECHLCDDCEAGFYKWLGYE